MIVTSLARTLLDAATSPSFARAVAMVDAGLRPVRQGDFLHSIGVESASRDELLQLHAARLPYLASTRAVRVIEFGDGRSGSPGESFFRCQCLALGLPAPELQVEFHDEDGSIGFADFYWPHLGLIIEIDGAIKYTARRRFQLDLTLEQLLLAEKIREDRLRRVVRDFARPPMAMVHDRRKLATFLARHGLVPTGQGHG